MLCGQCRLPGDINGDGRVDLMDTGIFINTCMNGPAVENSNPLCEAADFDMNGTGDLKDFAGLQEVFNP
ncbi:MAG: dockerin type I domain-containing protein [Planctomycetota bacterium]